MSSDFIEEILDNISSIFNRLVSILTEGAAMSRRLSSNKARQRWDAVMGSVVGVRIVSPGDFVLLLRSRQE